MGVTLPSGTQLDYLIDPVGRRIAKRRDGELVQGFIYGRGSSPLAELTAQGTIRARFVYATRTTVPDHTLRDGRTYKIVTDQVGSPRAVVDSETGTVVQEIDYDEFGRVTRDTNPGFQPFGYAGGLYDRDTGLVRFGARDYDPDTGRWTAKDPIGFDGGDTNLYGYVLNDPVDMTDPTGLQWGEYVEHGLGEMADSIAGLPGDAYDAFTGQAQDSMEYWADVANDECAAWPVRALANVAGPLAALGTEENLPETAATLTGAGVANAGFRAFRAGWRITHPRIHPPHHRFPLVGKRRHIQSTVYKKGVKGSGRNIRIPLP